MAFGHIRLEVMAIFQGNRSVASTLLRVAMSSALVILAIIVGSLWYYKTESCIVDLASYGENDSPKSAYVRTSGGSSEDVLVLNKFGNHRSIQLGVTIMELDPKTCTTKNRQRFYTHSVPDDRVFLLDSLELKTTGTIIVGVTVDTAENEDNVSLRKVIGSFFAKYNMDLSDLKFRGKFVFIMQKGYPHKSILQSKPRYGESLQMKVALHGTGSDVTFKLV